MLIPDNIHPERCIYFNGSVVLDVLLPVKTMDFLDLFIQVRAIKEMSMPVFVLSLDWLFLLSVVRFDNNGKVELCF